jgi:hypothetical protein
VKLTARERWIVLLLPGAAVLLGYAFWFIYSQRGPLAVARQNYDKAVLGAVSDAMVIEQQGNVARLQRELKELDQKKTALDRQVKDTCFCQVDPARRQQATEKMTALLARHRLQLIDESPTAAGHDAKLPRALTETLGRLGSAEAAKTGQLRSYRLVGAFPDVLRAVCELAAAAAPPAVPISLTMAEADGAGPGRTWTLLVWM